MLRVYVAGAYSADYVVDVLGNMRRGIELSCDVLDHGMAPFCPWLDFQFGLNREFDLENYYEYSIAWLKASDAVLVVKEGWDKSKGTRRELDLARANGIPVFHGLMELILWRDSVPEQEHPRAREGKYEPNSQFRPPYPIDLPVDPAVGKESVIGEAFMEPDAVGVRRDVETDPAKDDVVEEDQEYQEAWQRAGWVDDPEDGDSPDFDAPPRAAYEPCGFDEGIESSTRNTGFKAILREMAELHDKKERDYGTEGDPLANIRGSEDFGVPAWTGCEVRLNDKQRRIHNFIRKRELVNESVEDSLLDRAVYSVIALQLYREQAKREEE